VLQVLFAADARSEDPMGMLEFLETHFESDTEDELQIKRVMRPFAHRLMVAVTEEMGLIDDIITLVSHHWKLYRINRVDRNVLRMAIAEYVYFHEAPGRVILNEAIELAKKYGTENSPSFVNGILDRVHAIEPRPNSATELKELLDKLDE
jgi:N utilization substance protein B